MRNVMSVYMVSDFQGDFSDFVQLENKDNRCGFVSAAGESGCDAVLRSITSEARLYGSQGPLTLIAHAVENTSME